MELLLGDAMQLYCGLIQLYCSIHIFQRSQYFFSIIASSWFPLFIKYHNICIANIYNKVTTQPPTIQQIYLLLQHWWSGTWLVCTSGCVSTNLKKIKNKNKKNQTQPVNLTRSPQHTYKPKSLLWISKPSATDTIIGQASWRNPYVGWQIPVNLIN